jgi:3alpha(or 20beta)-hydroxysteroid dehydrogenase
MDLQNKAVLITGAASGIGRSTARLVANKGARVAVCDFDVEGGKQVAKELGDQATFVELDVTSQPSWEKGVKEAVKFLGGIDIAHLNAGVRTRPAGVPTLDPVWNWLDERSYNRTFGVNTRGVMLGTMAVLPELEKSKGYLLITTSPAGLGGWGVDPFYSASKAAVNNWVQAMAQLLPEKGIRVNAVAPGAVVDTGMKTDDWADVVPGITLVQPEDIAECCLKILDEEGDGGIFITAEGNNLIRV